MNTLQVLFEVPDLIMSGLASGSLERVGGVVRDVATKQVVAWLRDGAVAEVVTHMPLSPASMVLGAARLGLSTWGTHSINANIIEQANLLRADIQTGVTTLASLTVLGGVGHLANFALTAVTLNRVLARLDLLDDRIEQMQAELRQHFRQERDVAFRTALQTARDVFESSTSTLRQHAATSAIERLYQVREHYLNDLAAFLKSPNPTPDHLMTAHQYYIRAIYASTARIRCYLSLEELKLAHQRLNEDVVLFRSMALNMMQTLQPHAALFFHPNIPPADLDRFLQVQRWLRDPDDYYAHEPGKLLFNLVNDMRGDFWRQDLIAEDFGGDRLRQIRRQPVTNIDSRLSNLRTGLDYAEAIIENYRRLLGFDLELRSIRLAQMPFNQWTGLSDEAQIQAHGEALLIDIEALERLEQRLSILNGKG